MIVPITQTCTELASYGCTLQAYLLKRNKYYKGILDNHERYSVEKAKQTMDEAFDIIGISYGVCVEAGR